MPGLSTALLDLVHELPGLSRPLVIGGGFGLYLTQRARDRDPERRTVVERDRWPPARATEDIDVLVPTEVLVDADQMRGLRAAIDRLGYRPLADFFQFVRDDPPPTVRIDLLTGDIPEAERAKVRIRPPRVRPVGDVQVHAYLTRELIALEDDPTIIPLHGQRSDGTPAAIDVHVPNPFTYLVMKLHAFDDRKDDERKAFGVHHAIDVYRLIAMMTRFERDLATSLARSHGDDPPVRRAGRIVQDAFGDHDSIGFLRMRSGARTSGIPWDRALTETVRGVLRSLFPAGG